MRLIVYRGRLAAVAAPDRAYLARHIDRLPDGHPDKRFVLRLCLHAHQLTEAGLLSDTVARLPAGACRQVREQLMPASEFLGAWREPDQRLAQRFNVPVEQVAARRRDLAAGAAPARPRRRRMASARRRAACR